MSDGGLRVIACGDAGANCNASVGSLKMDVHVKADESDGLAFFVCGDRRFDELRSGNRCLRRGLAGVVCGAGEDDFAAGLRGRWCRWRLREQRCAQPEHNKRDENAGPIWTADDGELHEPRPFNFFGFDGAADDEFDAPLPPAWILRWRNAS